MDTKSALESTPQCTVCTQRFFLSILYEAGITTLACHFLTTILVSMRLLGSASPARVRGTATEPIFTPASRSGFHRGSAGINHRSLCSIPSIDSLIIPGHDHRVPSNLSLQSSDIFLFQIPLMRTSPEMIQA